MTTKFLIVIFKILSQIQMMKDLLTRKTKKRKSFENFKVYRLKFKIPTALGLKYMCLLWVKIVMAASLSDRVKEGLLMAIESRSLFLYTQKYSSSTMSGIVPVTIRAYFVAQAPISSFDKSRESLWRLR